jgi:hypothetical protein
VHWLYNQELPPTNEMEKWAEVMETPTSLYHLDQGVMIVRLKTYVLADRFLDFKFCEATTQSIIEQTDHYCWDPSQINEFVGWAFENIRSDSPILQLMVNEFCHYWQDPTIAEEDVRALKEMPLDFTHRVVLRLHEMLLSPRYMSHKKACYLEHVSDNEFKACSKFFHVKYVEEIDYGQLREAHDMS